MLITKNRPKSIIHHQAIKIKIIAEIRIFQPSSIESKRASQKLSFLSFVTVSAAF